MVGIKGLEMPKSCHECEKWDVYSYDDCNDAEYRCDIDQHKINTEIIYEKKRCPNCPLVEIKESEGK